jgi:hypothetical protein
MPSNWKLIEKIENENKKRHRVEVNLYSRQNDYSFGVGAFTFHEGFTTPCQEGKYIYKSKREALTAAVEYLKHRIQDSKSLRENEKSLFKLLPDIEPGLFEGG